MQNKENFNWQVSRNAASGDNLKQNKILKKLAKFETIFNYQMLNLHHKMVTSTAHTDLSLEKNNDNRDTTTNNNNNYNITNDNNNNMHLLKTKYAFWFFLIVFTSYIAAIGTAQGAAIYSNPTNPNFESICHSQQERFIESDGKESSLILELRPGAFGEKRKSCTRILSAPKNYGFIVRLIIPKLRHRGGSGHHHTPAMYTPSAAAAAASSTATTTRSTGKVVRDHSDVGTAVTPALNGMTSLIEKLNTTAYKAAFNVAGGTRTCPLSIFSSLDPHTPQWRVDPCQLEDTAPEMEDPVRLFHGRLRVVWEHRQQQLHSKLMITALGKDEQCRGENKHPCLKIEDEPLLCISKDLVCDGIRHCPYRNDFDSDEDNAMCWQRHRIGDTPLMPAAMESDIFEHFALEVFRNLFAFDVRPELEPDGDALQPLEGPTEMASVKPDTNVTSKTTTTLQKVPVLVENLKESKNVTLQANGAPTNVSLNATGHGHRRNSTRMGLNSDLSKYGPWGYLMLGMLLCGGALLICGLWASASQHAAHNERESAMQSAGASSLDHGSSNAAPPNYEELDPPPAYSVLFPNQKAASNTTLNSMAATTLTATPSISLLTAAGGSGSGSGSGSVTTSSSPSSPSSLETTTSSMASMPGDSAATVSGVRRGHP